MHIMVALCYPVVFDEPPRCHFHPAQVAAGQWFLSLLDHHYPRPKMLEHEMFPQPYRTVSYCGATQCWEPYQLEYPWEGHHIGGRSLPFLINPPLLGNAYSMLARHLLFEGILGDRHSTLGAT